MVDHLVDSITEGVRTGRYVPGQRLVEADLTTEFSVSRGPLREALGRLAAEGLVEIEPYRGAVVRRLSRTEVSELYIVRQLLESEAARLAAGRIDEADNRQRLEKALEEMDLARAGTNQHAFADTNRRFHDLILELAGNSLLAQLASQLQTQAYRLHAMRFVLSNENIADAIDYHERVGQAILRGDGATAARAMRQHIDRASRTTRELPDYLFDTTQDPQT